MDQLEGILADQIRRFVSGRMGAPRAHVPERAVLVDDGDHVPGVFQQRSVPATGRRGGVIVSVPVDGLPHPVGQEFVTSLLVLANVVGRAGTNRLDGHFLAGFASEQHERDGRALVPDRREERQPVHLSGPVAADDAVYPPGAESFQGNGGVGFGRDRHGLVSLEDCFRGVQHVRVGVHVEDPDGLAGLELACHPRLGVNHSAQRMSDAHIKPGAK